LLSLIDKINGLSPRNTSFYSEITGVLQLSPAQYQGEHSEGESEDREISQLGLEATCSLEKLQEQGSEIAEEREEGNRSTCRANPKTEPQNTSEDNAGKAKQGKILPGITSKADRSNHTTTLGFSFLKKTSYTPETIEPIEYAPSE